MADLNAWQTTNAAESGGGLSGGRTRAQCAALARMRWQTLSHSSRSTQGAFEFAARVVSYAVYGAMGLGLGIGAGVVAYQLAVGAMWQYLPIEYWVAFCIWQLIPVALAAFQEQFDLSFVLRFPVSFSAFYALYLVFSLSDISTIIGGLCGMGIVAGIALAKPGLIPWAIAGVALFSFFNIVLVRVILAWVDRWLAQRRTRETVSALFLMFLLSLQLLNPALHQSGHGLPDSGQHKMRMLGERVRPYLRSVAEVQEWLPPGLAARTMRQAATGEHVAALGSLGVLGVYLLAVGGLLGARVRADYRGEELSEAPARKDKVSRKANWLLDGSGPIAAVLEKELRTVMRSMPLLYAMAAPLFMVLIFGSLLRNGGANHAAHASAFALPLCVGYALLGTSQMVYNNLGTEGTAIQLLFLSPTPIRRIMLAKNIFHGAIFFVIAALAALLASLRLGTPEPAMLAATVAWIMFALPANLAAGNIFSVILPHRTNLGRLKRQRISAASGLFSLFVQVVLLSTGAVVFGASAYLHEMWLAVPLFTALAAVVVVIWLRVLHNSDGLANRHRDELIAVLTKAD